MCIRDSHWPSRAAASPARERAGEQVRAIKDSLLREDSAAKIVIMGDINDDPMDKSMAVAPVSYTHLDVYKRQYLLFQYIGLPMCRYTRL